MTDSMVSHFDACLGLHGLRDRVPVGRAVRHPDRADPRPGRAPPRALGQGEGPAWAGLLAVPAPATTAAAARSAAAAAGQRARPRAAPHRTARTGRARSWPRWSGSRRGSASRSRCPSASPPPGQRRAVVGLLTGCVQGAFFPGVNAATARVLQAEGCDVVVPKSQGCCGALSVHNGREPEGQDYARKLVDAFERLGRGVRRGQLRRLRLDDEGVRRPAGRRPGVRRPRAVPSPNASATSRRSSTSSARSPPRHPLEVTIAYHDACHLAPRPGRARAAAPAARGDPGTGAPRDRRVRAVLRLGRDLQHPQPGDRERARRPQGRQRRRHRSRRAGHRQPGMPDAGHLGHRTRPATRWGWPTPSRCSTPRSAACRSPPCFPPDPSTHLGRI